MTAAQITELFPGGVAPTTEAPNSTVDIPGPQEPLKVARVLLGEVTEQGHMLVRRWRGEWWRYVGPHWVEFEDAAVRKWLYESLEDAVYVVQGEDGAEYKPWNPDKTKVDKVLDAMGAPSLLSRDVDAPAWLDTGGTAAGYVPCRNGLVDVNTRETLPLTPNYFGTVGIPLDYDPDAAEPTEWLKFLRELWPTEDGTDAEEIRVLRQWFGYVLSGRLDLQKMLLLIGPPRSGKGTIARILRDLIGAANCSAPTLAGIAQNFGLETSIGKTLMIVGDARLASEGQTTVVERLLSISGQDSITLDRKNKTAWTGTMQTRVMILSNELPKFLDASGAIASRFVILKLEESFLGREDTHLETRLRAEFPAILKWALAGLVDLTRAGRLHEGAAHRAAMEEMTDLVSPISAFLRDVCGVDSPRKPGALNPDATVAFSALYQEYDAWCAENGRHAKNTAGFSADLKTQMPGLKTDHRPYDESGRKLPRHVKGLTVSTEWKTRVRDATPTRTSRFRGSGGDDYVPASEPMPGY